MQALLKPCSVEERKKAHRKRRRQPGEGGGCGGGRRGHLGGGRLVEEAVVRLCGHLLDAQAPARLGARLEGEALIAALKAQLANFKIPKRCFVVDELPRNAMGKVQKNVLRKRYATHSTG